MYRILGLSLLSLLAACGGTTDDFSGKKVWPVIHPLCADGSSVYDGSFGQCQPDPCECGNGRVLPPECCSGGVCCPVGIVVDGGVASAGRPG